MIFTHVQGTELYTLSKIWETLDSPCALKRCFTNAAADPAAHLLPN